jgi:hypothetical protein
VPGSWIDGLASFDCSPSPKLRVALRMRSVEFAIDVGAAKKTLGRDSYREE